MRTYSKDSFDYSKVVDVVVDMKPVDVRPGPVKTNGRRRSSIVSKPPDNFCIQCLTNVSFLPHIHCLECKRADVTLCLPCFQLGAEIGEHLRGHNYEITQRCGPPVFREDANDGPRWGSLEDERLLSLIRTYKLDDWPKIAFSEFGQVRTVEEALNHFSRCFLNSMISEIAIEEMTHPPIHAFGLSEPEIYTGEFFQPTSLEELKRQIKELHEQFPGCSKNLLEVDYAEPAAIRPTKLSDESLNNKLENMICEFSHIHVEHNPDVLAERLYGQPRCFIHHRFTHLHKSQKHNQTSIFTEESKINSHDQLDLTPRSRKISTTPAILELQKIIEKSETMNSTQLSVVMDDSSNVEVEELIHNTESSLTCNGEDVIDKQNTSVYAISGRILENDNLSPQLKSPLGEFELSAPPTLPNLTKLDDEMIVSPSTLNESSNLSDNDDKTPETVVHGYDVRERNIQRRRETFSYSPPKIRGRPSRSGIRGRPKKKKVPNRMFKSGNLNGVMAVVSSLEVKRSKSCKHSSHARANGEYLSMEKALTYRLMYPTLKFVSKDPPLLSKQKVRRFDADDLNLIAYNPKRDDFEHEYRNSGELFISKIFLNGECLISSEIEQFKNAIRVAKVQRYNRILERRFSNHAVIREHQLLNEFFSIVKTNVNERGKYTLFAGESFPSRKRAEECRPYFAKLRRVLGSQEVLDLAEDIAEMDMLMSRIRMLRTMQLSGTTELKGRLKTEVAFTPRNRKKRTRKADGELRKAGLRWERIKRWNKRVNETS